MSRSALTGTRIRARRTLRGIRQTDLAREVGVSPSYLNLIEHNRRKVSAPLLSALAQALGVSSDALVEDSDTQLVEGARAAALRSDTELGELERIDDLIGRVSPLGQGAGRPHMPASRGWSAVVDAAKRPHDP